MLIYLMDLKHTGSVHHPWIRRTVVAAMVPDGKQIVAMTRIGDALMIYETTSGKWSELPSDLPELGVWVPAMVKGWEVGIFWEQTHRPIYSIRIADSHRLSSWQTFLE